MNIGEKILELRNKKNISRKDLANALNVSLATITRYEKGDRTPNIEQLNKIAMVLDVPASQLVSNDEIIDLRLEQLHAMIDKYAAGETSSLIGILNPYEEILNSYDQLNELGQEKVLTYIEDLLMIDKYTK